MTFKRWSKHVAALLELRRDRGSIPRASILLRSKTFVFELRSNFVLLIDKRKRMLLRSPTAVLQVDGRSRACLYKSNPKRVWEKNFPTQLG